MTARLTVVAVEEKGAFGSCSNQSLGDILREKSERKF